MLQWVYSVCLGLSTPVFRVITICIQKGTKDFEIKSFVQNITDSIWSLPISNLMSALGVLFKYEWFKTNYNQC